MELNPLVIGSIIPVLISGTLAFITWGNRFGHRARLFSLLMAAICLWSAGEAFLLATSSLSGKITWLTAQYMAIPAVPVLLLLVIIRYTGRQNYITPRNIVLLFIIPLISFFLVWTNNHHHLFYSNITMDISGTLSLLSLSRGPLFWMHVAYSYSLVILAGFLLLQRLRYRYIIYRLQSVVFLVAIFVAILISVVYVTDLFPVANIDPSPFAFAVAGLIMVLGIFKYRMLDLVPVAREQIFESIYEAVVVVDDNGYLIDYNERAMEEFSWEKTAIGQPVTRLWENRPEILELYTSDDSLNGSEIAFVNNGETRYYQISTAPIAGKNQKSKGTILLFHDITRPKQAEEKYRLLAENTADAIYRFDPFSEKFAYVSPSIEGILGYAPGEEKHLRLEDILTPESCARQRNYVQESFAKGEEQGVAEFEAIHKKGHIVPVEVHSRIVNNADRGTFEVIGVVRDITERKKAEQSLRESERMLDNFFSQSLSGFFFMMFDEPIEWTDEIDKEKALDYAFTNQRMTRVNQAMLDQYGAKEENYLGLTPGDLFKHDLEHGRYIWRGLYDQGHWHVETNERRLDGTPIIIDGDYICLYDEKGRITGHFGVQHDITTRKQAEKDIKHRLELEIVIANISSYLVSTIDIDTAINNSLAQLGKSTDSSRVYLSLFSEDCNIADNTHEWCAEGVSPQSDNLKGISMEAYSWWLDNIRRGDGLFVDNVSALPESAAKEKELLEMQGIKSTFALPVRAGDTLAGFLGFDHVEKINAWRPEDIEVLRVAAALFGSSLERKKADILQQSALIKESELRKSLENEIKKRVDFTRVLVHELKTPLVPIIANSDILASELKEEPWTGIARSILRSGENLSERINELLDLARGEIGMLQITPRMINPSLLLSHIVSEMESVAKSRNQSLTLELPETLSRINADGSRLRQVINNLINNACKFSPSGSTIIVNAREEDDNLIIEVTDNGPGLTENDRAKIFTPYERLDAAGKEASGLGLGLALSKNLVELHQGNIWVKSQKGEGSTFGFSIPIDRTNEERS